VEIRINKYNDWSTLNGYRDDDTSIHWDRVLVEETINMEYEYGTHCGDTDCYSCATQRYNCEELTLLDNKTDMEIEDMDRGLI